MSLEINMQNVQAELRTIIQECFANVMTMLGEKNFLRWLDEERIDERLKTLIIECMTDTDKQNNPHSGGFMDWENNRLVGDYSSNEQHLKIILQHELGHFFQSRLFKKAFSGFINEGMTEYLTRMEKGGQIGWAYPQNVELVSFLHLMLGNVFIKAYLIGQVEPSTDKLSKYMGRKDFTQLIDALRQLYELGYKDGTSSLKYLTEFNQGDTLSLLSEACIKIAKGVIIEKCEKLEFYKDGKLDLEAIRQITGVINSMPSYVRMYLTKQQRMQSIYDEIFGEIIDRTHLLVDLPDEQKAQKRQKYIRGILSKDPQVISEIESNDVDAMAKMFEMKFKGISNIDLQTFVDLVASIISRFPNSTERQRHALVSQYMIQTFGNDKNIAIIDEYVNSNMKTLLGVEAMKNDRERDVIFSRFRMIDANHVIEQRDNEYHLLFITDDGIIIDKGRIVVDKDVKTDRFTVEKNGEKVGHGFVFDEFVFSKDIKDLKISRLNSSYFDANDPRYLEQVMSLEDFTRYLKFRPLISNIRREVLDSIIVEDDEPAPRFGLDDVSPEYGSDIKDYRTRRIDLEKLRKALKKLESFYPDEQLLQKKTKEFLLFLLGHAYDVKFDKESLNFVEILYSALMSDEPQVAKSMLADVEGFMNWKHREAQDKKQEGLIFKDENARVEYNRRKEEYEASKKARQERQEQANRAEYERVTKQIDESIARGRMSRINTTLYYTFIPDEVYESSDKYADEKAFFGLPHFIMPNENFRLNRPGGRRIEVELFRDDMLFAMKHMAPEQREQFVRKKAIETINHAYQLLTPEEQEEPGVSEDYQYMIEALFEYGMNGTPIDEELFEKANKRLNARRQRGYEDEPIYGAVSMSPEASAAYEMLLDLSKKVGPEDLIRVAKMVAMNVPRDHKGREVETW